MSPKLPSLLPLAIVAVFGLLQFLALALLWGHLGQLSPVSRWLMDNLTGTAWFYPLLWLHDLLINVLLCLPLVLLIRRISDRHSVPLLVAAVVPAFVYFNWPLLGSGIAVTFWHLAGWVSTLVMVPLAFLLMARFRQR
ncbi:hypothetical protein SAMN04487965_1946 [Microbulbifer donghaiensis]|uniref:Uncharacterized protein n=1 Tax=Microbulbifer donghaiensis TaxID=494016 RepID=A0A1M5AR73_9GAMM|nr:hypothetical protein [Microbulbifer donghaiensis]SHF32758.1 hypothetical protein SAMN04487965_1946 [Microbulbifer donghaiensis]